MLCIEIKEGQSLASMTISPYSLEHKRASFFKTKKPPAEFQREAVVQQETSLMVTDGY